MNNYKVGDEVIIKQSSKNYTGPYAGTIAKIIKIDNDQFCHVRGFDNKEFMCPYLYFDEDFFNFDEVPPIMMTCDCGAHTTWGKDCPSYYHYDKCSYYKPRGG